MDTQSNVNYVISKEALSRERRAWESDTAIDISQTPIKFGRPDTFTLMKEGKPITIDSVRAPPDMFKDGCFALLGLDAITQLGTDINYHIGHNKHVDIRYNPETYNNAVCIRAKQQAIHKIPKEKKLRKYTRKMERCLSRKIYLSVQLILKSTPATTSQNH